ncbi:DUF3372 domain-containing protein [Vibrio lentus]|nr:DUF3372 domain-containing protein [Vibrio lentus]
MQRDSYDSGDWYNRVMLDGTNNNWNVGLPREDKDGANWDSIKRSLLTQRVVNQTQTTQLTSSNSLNY